MTSNEPPAERAARGTRVAVFARAPVPGEAKTRLVPALGSEGAARLQERLVLHALGLASAARVGPLELWCAPATSHPFFARCAATFGAALREQQGADLGERMGAAFAAALGENVALVLIGSDCPALTPLALREAADALRSHDAVIAPAEDGGYVLVGLARPVPGLFEGIAWGGPAVMADTRARLARAGATWKELETFWDIDRPEDLVRLERAGLLQAQP